MPKKVPYDECRAVPSVECFFVLKTVDDLECAPVRSVPTFNLKTIFFTEKIFFSDQFK